jgi:hypothetical protein
VNLLTQAKRHPTSQLRDTRARARKKNYRGQTLGMSRDNVMNSR